jgi:glycerol-3-phosphate dehydrogenase
LIGSDISSIDNKDKEENVNANKRIHPELSILESEIYYLMDNEMAVRPDDIINRRLGLGFIDHKVSPTCNFILALS